MLVQPQRSFPEADGVSRPDAEAAKFAFVELHPKATTRVSGDFLRRLIAAVPYRIHTVLTDNCIQFTTPGAGGSAKPMIKEALAKGELFRAHSFELVCASADVDHRTTQPRRPWTNGQVERMNWRIKDATVKRFHYADHDELCAHLADFVAAYNYARRLKTMKGLTPYEHICALWTKDPARFRLNTLHETPGLNIKVGSPRRFPRTRTGRERVARTEDPRVVRSVAIRHRE